MIELWDYRLPNINMGIVQFLGFLVPPGAPISKAVFVFQRSIFKQKPEVPIGLLASMLVRGPERGADRRGGSILDRRQDQDDNR